MPLHSGWAVTNVTCATTHSSQGQVADPPVNAIIMTPWLLFRAGSCPQFPDRAMCSHLQACACSHHWACPLRLCIFKSYPLLEAQLKSHLLQAFPNAYPSSTPARSGGELSFQARAGRGPHHLTPRIALFLCVSHRDPFHFPTPFGTLTTAGQEPVLDTNLLNECMNEPDGRAIAGWETKWVEKRSFCQASAWRC